MAASRCSMTHLLLQYTTCKPVSKESVAPASMPVPLASKITRRKNNLRRQIRRTLPKPRVPLSNHLPQEPRQMNPLFTDITPEASNDKASVNPFPAFDGVENTLAKNEVKLLELHSSGKDEISRDASSVFGGFVSNFGMYFVGFFVVQIAFAVWILGKGDSCKELDNSEKERNSRVFKSTDSSKISVIGNGNVSRGKLGFEKDGFVHAGESELERKIDEIRALAREVREKEKIEGKSNELNSDSEDAEDGEEDFLIKSGIVKEVDARLANLKKTLDSAHGKRPASAVRYSSKIGSISNDATKDGLDVKEVKNTLLFNKKVKHSFRKQVTKPNSTDAPKGFNVEKWSSANPNLMVRGNDAINEGLSQNLEVDIGGEPPRIESKSMQSFRKKLEKEGRGTEAGNGRRPAGFGQATSSRRSKKALKSVKGTMRNKNGSSMNGEIGDEQVTNTDGDQKSDMWWLGLPHAFAIIMRRGSYHQDPGGLYTFKVDSQAQNDNDSVYSVAFEAHSDANNFCLLLDSFFEDVGDISADIAPLSRQELHDIARSRTMNLLVVKKGQLQLYAGQPLADVEIALRGLVNRNQG